MRFKKTIAAVVLFVLGTIYAFHAEADTRPVIGLSQGVLGPFDKQTQTIGVLHNDRWLAVYERFPDINSVTLARRVYLGERRTRGIMELGATYFDDKVPNAEKPGQPIVDGNLTFHLAIGAQYTLSPATSMEVKWTHNSTAGRTDPNTGIDRVSLTYTWRY